jgi:DNA mismatch endonuclease (patch repair protein)
LRFRVHYPVPGNRRRSIDIAFPGKKVAVFLDGCFWHGCPQHGSVPVTNREWWLSKIATNRARDENTDALLRAAGWMVVRVWEHEPLEVARDKVVAAVRTNRDDESF